jgi:hypothetical protein
MAEEDAVGIQVVVDRMVADKPAVDDMSVLQQPHQQQLKEMKQQQLLQRMIAVVTMVEALDVEHMGAVNKLDSLGY